MPVKRFRQPNSIRHVGWQRKLLLVSTIAFLGILANEGGAAEIVAFPGAEGYGRFAKGGRGAAVYHVTTLADSGAGSLREALEAQGPRTVVFDVSGTIQAVDRITVANPFVTIAGQTAPGEGVLLKTMLDIRTNDVIVQHLRVRPGPRSIPQPDVCDAIQIAPPAQRVILDHCSLSWASDETLSVYNVHDVTVQWCVVAESLVLPNPPTSDGAHGKGLLIGSTSPERITVHHNLLASNQDRNPLMNGADLVDVVNNVVYNYGYAATTAYPKNSIVRANIRCNVFIPGPATLEGLRPIRLMGDQQSHQGSGAYVEGNIWQPDATDGNQDALVRLTNGPPEFPLLSGAYATPAPVITDAPTAYDQVAANVGARIPVVGPVDQRILNDMQNRTGQLINMPDEVGGFPTIAETQRPPDYDTDRDGMPNSWETTEGLDPNDPSDGSADKDADGYTNLEEFLFAVANPTSSPPPPPPPSSRPNPPFDVRVISE